MTSLSEIVLAPVGDLRCSGHEMNGSRSIFLNDIELIGISVLCA